MLRLTGAFRYYFCSDIVSFKCRHNGLASYIKCSLHRDPSNGDIYIFMSKDQRKLRVFYYHHRGFILTLVTPSIETRKIAHKVNYN